MGNIKCLPQGFKQGMAAELGNLVYVAFRGTETIGDWLAKLDFIQTGQQHGWGRTERGFSGVYAGSALTIIGALRNAGNPTHVFVVGHSLGGSLATLCAADIRASLAANTT